VGAAVRLFSALPALALVYLPVLLGEIDARFHAFPDPAIMAGQIEQETCPSLTSKKCWNPRAELKTSREYGFGLGQLTIAYREDGSERFNTFNEVRMYDSTLAAWEWRDRYDAERQLRALVLKNKLNWDSIKFAASEKDRTEFMLYAYNGGLGAVLQDRRLCEQTAGCNPGVWTGNVELTGTKSRKAFGGVYGDQSPHSITRAYVKNIMTFRADRYRGKIHELHMGDASGIR
jgi:hypothetical protein